MRGDKRFYVILALVIFCLVGRGWSELIINEIMYAPTDNWGGSTNEWLELYNSGNESFNLSSCEIDGKSFGQNLISGYGYLVVARNLDKFKNYYPKINPVQRSFTLKNDQDIINLTCNNFTLLTKYLKEEGAYKNNKTLERNKKGNWKESLVLGGTPENKNSVAEFNYDYSVLKITEVMADPFGDDKAAKPLGEWIEVYNSGKDPVYLEGLVVYDSADDHELYVTQTNTNSLVLPGQSYGVIYRDSDSDFDLSKIRDEVRLYTGYPIFENVEIDSLDFAGAVEGMSFSKFNHTWYKAKPSPGQENLYSGGCDWEIDLEMSNSIFLGEELTFKVVVRRNYGEEENISVRGKIENLFGEVVKEYKPWTQQRIVTTQSKSYSPNLKEGSYQLSFELSGLVCDDKKLSNNKVIKLIAVNPQYQKNESSLKIEKLYLGSDNSVEWGDQFQVKVQIYKGQETKSAIELFAQTDDDTISKRTKINIYDGYKDYILTLPVQLIPNCHNKIEDGKVDLVLKGLGLEVEQEFLVEEVDSEICKDYLKYVKELEKEQAKIKRASAYQIIDLPTQINPGQVIRVRVQLIGDEQKHFFKAWSYLYKSSKCYSCSLSNREDNLIDFNLNENEVKQIELLVKVDEDMGEGDYKLKVKLQKDGQKTTKDLVKEIQVQKKPVVQVIDQTSVVLGKVNSTSGLVGVSALKSFSTKVAPVKEKIINEITGVVVYESSSQKAKNLIPYLLIAVFGLLAIVLIWKKL